MINNKDHLKLFINESFINFSKQFLILQEHKKNIQSILDEACINIYKLIDTLDVNWSDRNLFCVQITNIINTYKSNIINSIELSDNKIIQEINQYIWDEKNKFYQSFKVIRDKNKIQTPRGTSDLNDEYLQKAEHLKHSFFKLLRSHWFQKIETPIFEYSDIFKLTAPYYPWDKSYTFFDKSNRELILRPDINWPISRAILNNPNFRDNLPIKLFFSGNVYRYRSGKNRKREFEMLAIETYWLDNDFAATEIITIFLKFLSIYWLKDYYIEISHLDIIKDLLYYFLNNKPSQIDIDNIVYQIIREKTHNNIKTLLQNYWINEKQVMIILWLLSCWNNHNQSIQLLSELSKKFSFLLKRVNEINSFIQKMQYNWIKNIRFCLWKLDWNWFYNGLCYQIFAGSSKKTADGGSYDFMTKNLWWPLIQWTWIGFSLERLIQLIETKTWNNILELSPKVGISINIPIDVKYQQVREYIDYIRFKENIIIEEYPYNIYKKWKILKYMIKKWYKKHLIIEYNSIDNSLIWTIYERDSIKSLLLDNITTIKDLFI